MADSRPKNVAPRPASFLAGLSDSAWVAGGGALGTLARNGLEHLLPLPALLPGFPWPTFAINLSGAALLGFVMAWAEERDHPPRWLRPGAAIGFCGAYTTFSTASVEVLLLARDGHAEVALAYVVASLVLGVLVVTITSAIAVKVFRRPDGPERKLAA